MEPRSGSISASIILYGVYNLSLLYHTGTILETAIADQAASSHCIYLTVNVGLYGRDWVTRMRRIGQKQKLYDVEDIISKRITNAGKIEYKVQWKGFKTKTWEPVDNLDCSDLIQQYEVILIFKCHTGLNQLQEAAVRQNRNPIAPSSAMNRGKSMVKERPSRPQELCVAKDHRVSFVFANGKYENDPNVQQEDKLQATRAPSSTIRSKSMVKERSVRQSGRRLKTSMTTIPEFNSKKKNRDEAKRGKDTTKHNSKVDVGTQTNGQIVTMRIPAKHLDQTAEKIITLSRRLSQDRGGSVHQLNKDVVNNGRNIIGNKFGQENCPIQ
ncbi:chromo (CHRromatin organization MOdifier) domain-containing protein [Ditylenchus destructor]|uniref:Chromo (CHRromatin organization MOdifier) domain-containing protein n=1 Tax=Ditylenchus destructor TaxID=166010 RepID=A0AAD4NJW5_9BILA|nr:chromo (CHRromatin organization MOdifier) domain-containing protein [Ditylenchus destructor]